MVNKENTQIFQKRQLKWDSIILKLIQKKNFTGIKHGFVEDPLGMHRTPSNETLIYEIPNMITERNVVIAAKQEQKKTNSIFWRASIFLSSFEKQVWLQYLLS